MDGIFNINKPIGMTSHDIVAKMRKLLNQRRIGHAGTLDPAANGVLPICVGQATRVAEYLSESGKAYEAEILFGIVTNTYDGEGTIIRTTNVENLTLPRIQQILSHFTGPQMQQPPPYSAIKLQGRPAYKMARAGEEVVLEPRPVTISQLNIIAWNPVHPERLVLSIECSKGTYIRSLAYDLGEYLGYGAYLASLIRTRSGPFSLSGSITLEQLADAVASGTVQQYLYPADKALEHYPALTLDAATIERVQHGNVFKYNKQIGLVLNGDLARVYDTEGHFIAIAEWDADQHFWKPKKVFVP